MRDILENIFVTALEGGSNYWYYLPSKEVKKIREAVPKSEEPALSMAMFMAIFDKGVEVAIHDLENPEECLGTISLDSIMQTIKTSSEDENFSRFWESELNEDGDGESSDVIFQYLVMGEIVFG
jgi:hypothetical protein